MAQDKNLPEGTDKIISGASAGPADSEVVVTETMIIAETSVPPPSNPSSASSSTSGATGATGGGQNAQAGTRQRLMDKARSGKDKLSGQAADKTRDLVGQGLGRGGEALSNVSRLVGDTAGGLDERLGQEYGEYARRAAEAIERTAQSLRTKDPDELIDDTREFVRKSPGVAIAGAAIIGFALARLVKSGFDATRNEYSGGGDRGGRGGGGA